MIEAYLNHGYMADTVRIFLVRKTDYGKHVLHYSHEDRRLSWDDIGEENTTDTPAPTIELPGEAARVLLESLVRFYQGSEDTRALRRDYDAERKRVDTQAQVIADIAQTLAVNARQGGTHGG